MTGGLPPDGPSPAIKAKDTAIDIKETVDLSWDEFDELRSPRSSESDFDKIVERAVTRRGFLGGALAFGSGAADFGSGVLDGAARAQAQTSAFAFTPVQPGTGFELTVPEGYNWKPLVRWGDALWSEASGAYSSEAGVPVEMSDKVFGENTDGMETFEVDGHTLLAINSEYANPKINLPASSEGMPRNEDEVNLLKNIQGVTVLEIADNGHGFEVVVDSRYNRRITHETQMRMDGPVAGHALVRTNADPEGMSPRGTMNNCGFGKTLSHARPITVGMIDGPRAGLTRSRTQRPARALYGTASRMRPERTLSSSRSSMRI